jgi:hypothetical protein
MEELPTDKAKNGRPTQYDEQLAERILAAIRAGLTLERAAEYVGMNPGTVQGWTTKRQDFGRLVKKARREHEMALLQSVEIAGEKSWQARAWILERAHGYAQPSARLAVTQEHTHGISSNLASLLAGIAVKKKTQSEKIAQSANDALEIETKQLTNNTSNHLSANSYCMNKAQTIDAQQQLSKNIPRIKHKRMRLRKPRQSRPATTTPPATPPAPV